MEERHQLLVSGGRGAQFSQQEVGQEGQRAVLRVGGVGRAEKEIARRAPQHLGDVGVAVFHAQQEAGEAPRLTLGGEGQQVGQGCEAHHRQGEGEGEAGRFESLKVGKFEGWQV